MLAAAARRRNTSIVAVALIDDDESRRGPARVRVASFGRADEAFERLGVAVGGFEDAPAMGGPEAFPRGSRCARRDPRATGKGPRAHPRGEHDRRRGGAMHRGETLGASRVCEK